MISFTTLTEPALTDSLERHNVPMDTVEHDVVVRKAQEVMQWPGVQRLAASVCVLYGRSHSSTDLVAIMGAICLRLGWNAREDAEATRHAVEEIGYLMSDAEMEALRKEIGTKGV